METSTSVSATGARADSAFLADKSATITLFITMDIG